MSALILRAQGGWRVMQGREGSEEQCGSRGGGGGGRGRAKRMKMRQEREDGKEKERGKENMREVEEING